MFKTVQADQHHTVLVGETIRVIIPILQCETIKTTATTTTTITHLTTLETARTDHAVVHAVLREGETADQDQDRTSGVAG